MNDVSIVIDQINHHLLVCRAPARVPGREGINPSSLGYASSHAITESGTRVLLLIMIQDTAYLERGPKNASVHRRIPSSHLSFSDSGITM